MHSVAAGPYELAGPVTPDPGAAGPTLPTALHDAYGRQLAAMLELVRSGEAFTEPITAERLSLRLVGVLTRLHEAHQVDNQGRCSICLPRPRRWWRLWPRRAACTVHDAFTFHMLPAVTTHPRRPP